MSRRRRHRDLEPGRPPQATHWVWAAILGVLAGGVFYSYQIGSPVQGSSGTISDTPLVEMTDEPVAATSSILLGVAAPKADRDQAYLLALPGKTVEQQEMAKGWRLDMWQMSAAGELRMVPASPDGKAPILTDGGEWNVSMRGANGEPYIEPRIVGFADATHVFVLATTDAQKLLLVSRSGEIRSIYDVPLSVNVLPTTDGHAWFSTYTQGEGIESEPTGPSRLIRVSVSGMQESLAEETRFIVAVTPGPDAAIAYRTDDGDMVVTSKGKRWSGNGVPLLWLDENRLLLSQGRSVFVLDMTTLTLELLQQLPAAPSAAHML